MNDYYKMSTFNDLEENTREDINQTISALVRMGYNVWMVGDYICFEIGHDDIVEIKKGEKWKNLILQQN